MIALATVLVFVLVGYFGSPFWLWSLALLAAMVGFGAPMWLVYVVVAVAAIGVIKPLRQVILSGPIMKTMQALKIIPKISPTERTALEAGVVWMEKELFSGKPDFNLMMSQPYPKLTKEEQDFLDGPVEEVCKMVDDWQAWKERDIPKEAVEFCKKNKFLGMIIPKEYGGLGFSHYAHSQVIHKLSSRSSALAIFVMVPNSLGPAELLNHYGTQKQKNYYLPRLAIGDEVPCFGLTEPTAGSDAGSILSEGVLFKGDDGKIYVRLTWKKRWITLASIATVLGVAFKLRDPDNLLGQGEDLGITCALVPANAKGVVLGRRHDPLTIPFHNCPMEGHDVVVDADECIIGGLEGGAGKGWGMLMESLAAGRGVSLPAQGTVGTKFTARVASAHAVVRRQFGISIGKFEGIEEPLARIAGAAYYLEAMRNYVLSALDQGVKPPVVTAMAKYNATEGMRKALNDGMDIMGGQAISFGARNLIGIAYVGAPISITVEGANILTRTLIIFGQGAMRAHPYAFREVDAVEKGDVKEFDLAFWGHIGHIARNLFRSVVLSVTRGRLAMTGRPGPVRRYAQKLAWASASFAIMADIAMGALGGQLKVKEKLTGRFADIMSWMFIGTAVLRRWEADGCKKEDLPFVHYSMRHCLGEIQNAFDGIFGNMTVPGLSWFFTRPLRWWSRLNFFTMGPDDRLGQKVARLIQTEGEQRDRLTNTIYLPKDPEEALGRLEAAFTAVNLAEPIEKKIKKAVKAKKLPRKKPMSFLVEEARKQGIIDQAEYQLIKEAERLRLDYIQVDDFSDEEFATAKATPATRHDFHLSEGSGSAGKSSGGGNGAAREGVSSTPSGGSANPTAR
ncbi:MAG: acyl-CoA dehydrogenase [Bdellovibrionaceae bacterium]|nr:acyl-CoA dehydrogenase [Bdellovibrionales bacterium]MCB9084157.1 acyl-CoA dehydrogenase [Pseudobdellovibrionaceae bacterium]